MSSKKRSSVSKGRYAKTDAYRGRFEKNYVKARNPWPDPFASSRHHQNHQVDNQRTTTRRNDNSQQSRSKSDHQNKTSK